MPEPTVMTVIGPMPASALGVTDAHEHLFLRTPVTLGQEMDDLDRAVTEVREVAAAGLRSIVEMTPIGLGRRPDLLRTVSEATGVPIIGATGYHRDAHYPADHWVHRASVATLAERVVTDLTEGMHPSDWTDGGAPLDPARAGAIKAGASYHHISVTERRRLEACAIGSRRSGAAILVHAEVGTAGHEIVDLLESCGVPTERMALAHMDRNPDAELHAEIASRGVTLEYDTLGRTKYHPDSTLLDLIGGMVEAGHGDRLMLGCDLGRRDYFRSWGGGPGLAYLLTTFVPRLRRRIGDAPTDAILIANPARFYALAEPRT
ncbi:MAG: phosphotriesterase family protein [Candidatus Limnocylindria bacterium]